MNGEPWFVGKDVTHILGYRNASKALNDHVDSEDKLNNESLSSLGQRGGWLINESGVYSLILSSKLPNAKSFKRWVTSEILPALRKTGGYTVNDSAYFISKFFPNASEQQQMLMQICCTACVNVHSVSVSSARKCMTDFAGSKRNLRFMVGVPPRFLLPLYDSGGRLSS